MPTVEEITSQDTFGTAGSALTWRAADRFDGMLWRVLQL